MKCCRAITLALLPLLLGTMLLAGCRGGSGSDQSSLTDIRPPDSELHDFLMSELARLGKDPAKTTSEAAKGDANRVFDLDLALIDPDGPGGDPPTGVSINWSEVLIGDYDQNGQVNVSDLTPLGRELNSTVVYDDKTLHGGFAGWPTGDPTDDGGETPPATESPAANWRQARIDGDRNGLLTQADITPIAVHWQEALSGYRIYRQAPGETEFTILPGQPGTSDGLSVNHPTAPGNAPVLYSFEDENASASGIYLYYVAPFDLQSQQQGPASGIVSIDLDTGTVNSSPVANLSVTPDFAGAPAEITLDASASYDPDGSIAAWEWDFDGDGITDWLSTDPIPETSSDGTVDSFVEVKTGKMRASYNRGNADYLHPSVTAIDDLSAASLPIDAQLGISGWVDSEFIWATNDNPFSFTPARYFYDELTGQLLCTGTSSDQRALYLGIRTGFEQWEEEKVFDTDDPVVHAVVGDEFIRYNYGHPVFRADGSPIVFITVTYTIGFANALFLAEKNNGTWDLSVLYESPEGFNNATLAATIENAVTRIGPSEFLALVGENYDSRPEPSTSARYLAVHYDNGEISVENPSLDLIYKENQFRQTTSLITTGLDGKAYIPLEYAGFSTGIPEIRYLVRDNSGIWKLQQFSFPEETQLNVTMLIRDLLVKASGEPTLLISNEADDMKSEQLVLANVQSGDWSIQYLQNQYRTLARYDLHEIIGNRIVTCNYNNGLLPEGIKNWAPCFAIEGPKTINENLFFLPQQGNFESGGVAGVFELLPSTLFAVISANSDEYSNIPNTGASPGAFIRERVDPRN
ncbi:PKD domain-containing protein [bacterium]|nr:PKD domain-containing protein [bacterium]